MNTPLVRHRVVHGQVIFLADVEVFEAVRRSGMHGAGTGFGGDVIAEDDGHLAIVEGVLQFEVFQFLAPGAADFRELGDLQAFHHRGHQRFGQHHQFLLAILLEPNQHVIELFADRHRLAGGQCPRRGGPSNT